MLFCLGITKRWDVVVARVEPPPQTDFLAIIGHRPLMRCLSDLCRIQSLSCSNLKCGSFSFALKLILYL